MRTRNRMRNYAKTRGGGLDHNRKIKYTLDECDRILAHSIPDRELAKQLGRSVQAIQITRARLKKGG
jgi:hypothetical protein